MQSDELFIESNLPKQLKKEELYHYFEKMKLGDMTARDNIINHNIRLVIHQVTKKFSNTPYDLKELVSIGIIGLIKSVDTFDTTKGFQFATYSIQCINNEILMFIRKGKKYIGDTSLDQFVKKNNEENKLTIEDLLSDPNSDFVSDYENNESYKIIRAVIHELPKRDKDIVIKYFGFIDNKPLTQKEIANELRLSQSYVSRLIKRVLKNISIQLKALEIIDIPTTQLNDDTEKTEQGVNKMPRKLQTIYEYFKEYTKKQIDEMLSKLTEQERLLITLRYGNDLDNPITSKKWDQEKSLQYYGTLLPKMKKLLANPNYVFRNRKSKNNEKLEYQQEDSPIHMPPFEIINPSQDHTECISKSTVGHNIEKHSMKKEEYIRILQLLKTVNFEQMLTILTPKEAIIICLRLGYVDDKYFPSESIAEFLGIDLNEVIESTKKVLLLYKNHINELIDHAIKYTSDNQNTKSLY